MRVSQAPTIFDSFNARALKPSEVASTFVPPQQYKQLIKRRHSIIVGPRGSGKTTLLKMLQQPALEAWGHAQADTYRTHINYTGVFVATDVSWGAQIEALGEGKLDKESHKRLSIAVFTTHILRSLIISMLHRIAPITDKILYPFRRVDLSNKDEARLVKALCEAWKIKPEILSLLSLKQALSIRLLNIREIANREAYLDESGRPARLGDVVFLDTHFVDALQVATDYFNDLINDEDGQWALLFDELELAPQWIQDELLRSLRSTDSKFLFKLAMSPFSYSARLMEMESGLSPAPDQDFEQIPLWYVEKNQSYKFGQDLWYSMLKERGIESKSPKDVLGPSVFETYYEEWAETGSAYTPDSKLSNRFVTLSINDASFRHYLSEKKIDPHKLHLVPKSQMDSIVRKISPLIAVREYYRAPDRDRVRNITRRTRKSAALYAGAESLFAITEGNPRWFIAVVGRLLDRWQNHSVGIKRGAQAYEMKKAAQRFSAMLRTIPVPSSSGAVVGKRGLLSLIEAIGKFFHNQVVVEDFIAEPPTTFSVDPNTNEDILILLGQALNAGAIVYVPDDNSQLILPSLRSKRFRLSYLLAPLYGLPLRLGVQTSLARILKSSDTLKDSIAQLLFEEEFDAEGDEDE